MSTMLAAPGGFSRELFQNGERLMIMSNCEACGEARIGSSYDDSLQEWESSHACASYSAKAVSA